MIELLLLPPLTQRREYTTYPYTIQMWTYFPTSPPIPIPISQQMSTGFPTLYQRLAPHPWAAAPGAHEPRPRPWGIRGRGCELSSYAYSDESCYIVTRYGSCGSSRSQGSGVKNCDLDPSIPHASGARMTLLPQSLKLHDAPPSGHIGK